MGFIQAKKPKALNKPQDSVGGFTPIASDVYPATIKMAYFQESQKEDSESVALRLELELEGGRKSYQTLYITGADGNVFSEYEGRKAYKKGYLIADALALVATEGEAGILDLDAEDRTIKVKREGKEVNEVVPAVVDLIGVQFQAGIIHAQKWKQNNVDGEYIDTDEIINEAELHTVFDAEGFTVNELQEGVEEPVFIETWLKAWKGKTKEAPAKKETKGLKKRSSDSGAGKSRERTRRSMIRGG